MSDGLTLTITGGDRWRVPQPEREARVMATYTQIVGDVPDRCKTCAFRGGTEANRSFLVLHLIERCLLQEENNFMCHYGLEDGEQSERACAGFTALREAFATQADGAR